MALRAPSRAWDFFFLAAVLGYVGSYFTPTLLLTPTITSGGDTMSHYFTARFLTDHLLPTGALSGWCHGNLAGFPMLQYYFPLPFLLMAALSPLIGLPVAFKLVSVLGVFLLPLAVYAFFRLLRQPFPVPVIGAFFSLVFLFNEGNKMWGGNIPSTLAGEFCYTLGFSLAVLWMGLAWRAVEKSSLGRIAGCSLLLAAVGLSHAYALLFAGFGSGIFLLTRKKFKEHLNALVKIHALAFCLLGFWILPLAGNLPWTTKFNILWIFHSWSQAAREILPALVRPFAALTLLAMALSLAAWAAGRLGRSSAAQAPDQDSAPPSPPLVLRPMVFVGGLILVGLAMYFAGYRARVVDVRFLPFFQLFLIIGGALLFKGPWISRGGRAAPVLLAGVCALSTLLWVDGKETFVRDWVRSSYEGVETKPLWPAYKAVNNFLAGGWNDPRVLYEHTLIHQGAGSVRAFEDLPLFSGRSTLECVYIQASITAPFVFYLQSETCTKPSTPIPEVFFSRFNLDRAVEHMRLFNVNQFIAAEKDTKLALDERPDFILDFMAPPYRVYRLLDSPDSYVKELAFKPVLLPLDDWMQRAYTWFRLGGLEVLPVFSDDPGPEEAGAFAAAPEANMRALPAAALPGTPSPTLGAEMQFEKIAVTGATPGRPLLVKVSYHPGWKSSGGEKIHLAGPGFMLLFPRSSDFTLEYGPTPWDWAGKGLTLAAVLAVILFAIPAFSRFTAPAALAFDRHAIKAAAPLLLALAIAAGLFLGKKAPEFPAVPFNKGLAYFRQENYDAARKVFEYILEKHGQSMIAGEAAYHYAMCYFREKDYESTVRALERTLRLYPETPRAAEILYHMGLCRIFQQRFTQARQAFDRTVDQFPGSSWAKLAAYQNAMIFYRGRDFANALLSLDRLLALDPDPPLAAEAWFHVGLCNMELGKGQEAREAFNRTASRHPDTQWAENALFHLGISFYRENNFQGALYAMDQFINKYPLSPQAPEAWYHVGMCHKNLGQTGQARQAFESLMAKFPVSPWSRHARERLAEF